MRRAASLLCVLLSVGVLTACGTTSGGSRSGSGSNERPILDSQPATAAEARALINVELGTAYLEVGRYDVAMDEARSALAHSSAYPPALHLLALVYMAVGDTAVADDYFQRTLRSAPNDPDFNNSYGWFQCVAGRFEDGLRRLDLAARNPFYRHPTRPYTNAGLCRLMMGDLEAARENFRRAVMFDDSNAQALYNLAEIDFRRGDNVSARDLLVRLHRQHESTPESLWLGVRAERRLGNHDAAASYAAQLANRFEGSPEYQSMLRGEDQ